MSIQPRDASVAGCMDPLSGSPVEDQPFPDSFRAELEDDSFQRLKNWFEAKGRGRRCSIPTVAADYRLFLQLYLLRIDYDKTWEFVEELLVKIFPLLCSRPVEFRGILDRCVRGFKKQLPEKDSYKEFLARSAVNLPPLVNYSVKTGVLITAEDLEDLDIVRAKVQRTEKGYRITKEFVVKAERFRKLRSLNQSYTFKLLECYGLKCNCGEKKGKKVIGTVLKDYEKKVKSRNKSYGAEQFDKFCQEIFEFTGSASQASALAPVEDHVATDPNVVTEHADADIHDSHTRSPTPSQDESTTTTTTTSSDVAPDVLPQQNESTPPNDQSDEDGPLVNGIPAERETTLAHVMNSDVPSNVKLGTALKSARVKIEEMHNTIVESNFKISVLSDENAKKQKEICRIEGQFKALNNVHSETVKECNRLITELSGCKAELTSTQHANYYKRLQRKEAKLSESEAILAQHREICLPKLKNLEEKLQNAETKVKKKESELNSNKKVTEKLKQVVRDHEKGICAIEEANLKQKIKNLQTSVCDQKHMNSELRDKIKDLKSNLTHLTQECDRHILAIDDLRDSALQVKDGGHYSDQVVKCTIQLIGEAGIAAAKCPEVIKCIAKCIFNKDISLNELPSLRTTLRMADRGHVLAKVHLAESLQTTKGFDLHTDGTTRDHRKYVGNQATLAEGRVMSLGYTMVVTEDTETLVDVAVSLLTEIADVYSSSQEELESSFKQMLKNMVALMSDRASVMKSFNNAFNAKRDEILGDNTQLQFIYCSAHFLLGLSSEGEKAIKGAQADLNHTIGRDTLTIFKSFKGAGESAVSRLVRTACDVLGPRGDDKSGCRDAWEAYCQLKGIDSNIKSYRGNRFNNFFESAAAIFHHRQEIIRFFSNFNSKLNLKLQSVLADLQSDEVVCLLAAVGITYFVVTGPYWNLIRSSIHYLDLYKYIEPMTEKFEAFAHDPQPLLEDIDKSSVIPDFSVQGQQPMLLSLNDVPNRDLLYSTLQKIFKGFHAVALRQLGDFLPDGIFYNIQDADLRAKMQHCQLTNLTGEANLADLDFSIFTRRHASLHYRSFINMMVRNKTMSSWFDQKSVAEQQRLLKLSAQKAGSLRKKHVEQEKEVIAQRRRRLEKTRDDIEAQRQKMINRKATITATVKKNGGPCLKPRDVDALVKRFRTVTAKKAALNAEVQFQKTVLGMKHPSLKTSKLTCDAIVLNLKAFLLQIEDTNDESALNTTIESDEELATTLDVSDSDNWLFPSEASESETEVESSAESSDENGTENPDTPANEGLVSDSVKRPAEDLLNQPSPKRARHDTDSFKFTNQGAWVAVLYTFDDERKDPKYFIGQVLDVKDENVAIVTFMEKCGIRKNMFRFPPSPDIDEQVNSIFVFHSDFNVTSDNGRMWTVPDIKVLEQKFRAYVKHFCRM